jgi:hypothetical protein
LFTWYSATPSCPIMSSNCGSFSSFSKMDTAFQRHAALSYTHIWMQDTLWCNIIIIITEEKAFFYAIRTTMKNLSGASWSQSSVYFAIRGTRISDTEQVAVNLLHISQLVSVF